MNSILKISVCSVLALFFVAGSAVATPFNFGDGGSSLQGVLDDITVSPNSGQSSVDVTQDALGDGIDSYWTMTGTGGSIATMIIELASFASNNSFGVYDPYDSNNTVELFGGSDGAGAMVTLAITAVGDIFINNLDTGTDFKGTSFGYYLDSSFYANGGVWYSDTGFNNDGLDHMAAYKGKNIDTVQLGPWVPGLWTDNEFVLAFEDLRAGVSDLDYTDMVVMVESVRPAPVPEPATMLLFGFGLLGMGAIRRKKLFKNS